MELSPEHRALRAQHIGGSEVAALFDEHPQLTKFELWHRKKGNLPDPDLSDNERVFWGNMLEPAIAEGVAAKNNWTVRKVRRYVRHPKVNGLGGSLDYEIVDHAWGPGILEIKTADWLVVKRWPDGEPPLSYELQVQTYMAITSRAWGAMAVLVGGNDLRIFIYQRRPRTIALIEQAVKDFWLSIAENREPKPDFLHDGAAIAELYRQSNGEMVDMTGDNRLPELIALYKEQSEYRAAAERGCEAAKAEIMQKIGTAEIVICGPHRISTKTVKETEISYTRKAYRGFRITSKGQDIAK